MAQNSLSINECKQCKSSSDKCTEITKCFSCFSRHHHTFLCPVRNTNTPKWFVPKIDKDLLTRFFKTFDPLEQYSMVISIPETLNFIGLKKVQVKEFFWINLCKKSSNDDTIVVVDGEVRMEPLFFESNKIVFDSNLDAYLNFIEAVSKKQLFIKARKVTLANTILSLEFFSYLLSPIIKVLHCYYLTLTPTITFAEILQKLLNLEDLLFMGTNVEMGNEWVEDLKIYGKNIIKLNIEISNFNFNAKELAKIVKLISNAKSDPLSVIDKTFWYKLPESANVPPMENISISSNEEAAEDDKDEGEEDDDVGHNNLKELEKIIGDGMNKAYFKQLSTGRRLGTGSFGTVFDATFKSGEKMALKIILLNDEKIIKSVMLEIKIMKAINYINCSNFIRLIGASIKYGKFLRVSEEDKNDPDDGEKEKKEEDVPKLLLLLSKGGSELENFMVKTKDEIISIIIQVAATMAMGEEMLELEHRDSHVSNILVEETKEKELGFFIRGKKCFVKSNNIMIKIIDFGKSRLQNGNEIVYCDEWEMDSNESNQTEEDEELHYEIYDQMNEIAGCNWKGYYPATNVLWICYLIQILSRFDASGLASEDPGTQAFKKLRNAERNK